MRVISPLIITLVLCLALSTSVLAAPPQNAQTPDTAMQLYRSGDIDGARRMLQLRLRKAKRSSDKPAIWSALMALSRIEEELANHRASIEFSNKALSVATQIDDQLMLGRSMCWLGWSYSSLGLYELALSFYENAVEIGAPKGVPTIISVWGLASQEIGAIRFKTGDTAGALEQLNTTYNYAKKAGIDVGVAEGGAHLAEIYLATGKYREAEEHALLAIAAASRCGCSPYNSARARVVSLQVALDKATRDAALLPQVQSLASTLAKDCESRGLRRCQAQAMIIESKTIAKTEFSKRFELVEAAFRLLADTESELRGSAEGELGRVFLDDNKDELAEFYLKNGYAVNKELFRKVDKAYITLDLAYLAGARGEQKKKVKELISASDRAMESDALPLALTAQRELCSFYEKEQLIGLAIRWCERTYQTLKSLRDSNFQHEGLENLDTELLIVADKVNSFRFHQSISEQPPIGN